MLIYSASGLGASDLKHQATLVFVVNSRELNFTLIAVKCAKSSFLWEMAAEYKAADTLVTLMATTWRCLWMIHMEGVNF